MIKVPFRAVLIFLIALVAVGGVINLGLENKNADTVSVSEGACSDKGVTLVVDFGSQSDRVPITKCVSNFTGSGWELFDAAGVDVAGTAEYPEAFVCRINNFPTSENEDCLGTPDLASGSWAYFYSSVSSSEDNLQLGKWQRSPVGAATRVPACGEFEGWFFIKANTEKETKSPSEISTTPAPFMCK
jgi:hypothetical protein